MAELINRKTVLEYKYESERDMLLHEKIMKQDGWYVEPMQKQLKYFLGDLYKAYSKVASQGAFLSSNTRNSERVTFTLNNRT
ncbi:hypothetical protein [Cytobacillus gottheilii]|uniref:hypothetical protein n=1 Tax=Cytobacillus gottheilii TaxID=859144 RepID=UPI0009B99E34|nr:hypothetical protein [Cytobacillus gottheilii]